MRRPAMEMKLCVQETIDKDYKTLFNIRSLRTKLFLSVGCILLINAALSDILPRIFIRKDIDNASNYISQTYDIYLHNMQQISNAWVTYRFARLAAQLDAVTRMIQVRKGSLWHIATSALRQDPEIAMVQVSDNAQTAIISAESAHFYIPLWALDLKGQLWIKLPETQIFLRAQPLTPDQKETYLLFASPSEEKEARTLSYVPFQQLPLIEPFSNNPKLIYEILRFKENLAFEKVKMIEELIPWKETAAGILHIDSSFSKGVALLTEDTFSTTPVVQTEQVPDNFFVVYRPKGPYFDLVQFVKRTHSSEPLIALGYSLSGVAMEIAQNLHRPILLYYNGALVQGFTPHGNQLPLKSLQINNGKITWASEEFFPSSTSIGQFSFVILIPESQKSAIIKVLAKVRDSLVSKISDNLFLISLVLLAIALILLARISKKITKPITQLALASEKIGNGKYEDLDLPPPEKWKDEVATLTQSFQKMVVSLRDREKMRGILNKVVSKEIAAKILGSSIELGGEVRVLTMLFSDIRGFTPLSETLSPPKLIQLLNTYMTRMCHIIDETHGVVDKFVGDEIMALYGAPVDLENHAEKAIEAALLMIADLKNWNQERGEHEPQITVGIGIHTGVAFAGNMGAEDRLNYTVVGANVNLAARLCSAAKPMQILVSESTYNTLSNPQQFHFTKLDPIPLKGIDAPVPIYEVS